MPDSNHLIIRFLGLQKHDNDMEMHVFHISSNVVIAQWELVFFFLPKIHKCHPFILQMLVNKCYYSKGFLSKKDEYYP